MMEQAKANAEAARLRKAEEDEAEAAAGEPSGAAVPGALATTLKLEEGEADELFDDDDGEDDEDEMLEQLGEGIKAAGLGG